MPRTASGTVGALAMSIVARPTRLHLALVVPVLLLIAGTIGYHLLEGWPVFDAFYMTVITLTTVGYGETHPLSNNGRAFTTILLLGGVFTLFYAATEVVRSIITGELADLLGRQRKQRSLARMKDHVIVCGYGRVGRFIAKEMLATKLPFVVIERQADALADLGAEVPGLQVQGDATDDDTLRTAGVERARALIAALPSDADNLYVTMTARFLNERLFIVARAESESAEQKLLRAGANRVVSPYVIAGHRVVQAVLRPAVVDFLEMATRTAHFDLQIEEVRLDNASPLVGMTLRDSPLRREIGVAVLAVKRSSGELLSNPGPDVAMTDGDTLIALGNRAQLDQLEALARSRGRTVAGR